MKIFVWISLFLSLVLPNYFFAHESIRFTHDDGFIIINEVEINKTSINGNFLFDTGAQITVIDSSLLEFISYKEIGKINSIDIYGNSRTENKINISSIKIGNKFFYNIDAYVTNLYNYNCENFIGILGFNLIKKANWQINFENQTIKITNGNPTIYDENLVSIPFKTKNNSAIIDLKIGKKILKTILDTGAKSEINLAKRDLHILKNPGQFADSLYTVELYSQSLNEKDRSKKTVFLSKLKNISIQNNFFEKKVTFYSTRVLGMDFFRNSSFLVLNFKDGIVSFSDNKSKLDYQIITKHGIKFSKLDNGEIIVTYLRKNSVFDKLGIQIGDKVLSVNSIDCYNIDACQCKKLLDAEITKDSLYVDFEVHKKLSSSAVLQ
jgi:predicted aspartyl protease